MEDIKRAYDKVEEARKRVFDVNNRAAMHWNSPEQKAYEQAKDDFIEVVNASEYDDIFRTYADETNRWQ